MAPANAETQARQHVVIVGAGYAGLAAAKRLQESGAFRVTILEATSRVGGRAKAALLVDGQRAELGATWLHGTEGHPVYELAIKLGIMRPNLKKGPDFWKGSCFAREGEAAVLDDDEAQLASHAVSVYAESVDELEEAGSGSAGDFIRRKFEELQRQKAPGASARDAEILTEAWGWRELLQRNIDGSDCTDDGNAAALAEYEDLPGPFGTIPGGYQTVAEAMAKGLEVRHGWAVEGVAWSSSGVQLACSDGRILEADAAVVTVPLGVLKERHGSMFSPPLPERKARAIARMGMGVVDKLFITFASADQAQVQPHRGRAYNLLWRQQPERLSLGDTPELGPPAILQCFTDSNGAREAGAPWHQGIYSLRFGGCEFIKPTSSGRANGGDEEELRSAGHNGASTESGMHTATAVAWIAGHHAANMEACSEEELEAGINAVLDAFPAVQLPRSFKVTRSTWGRDPFARGSYSYVSSTADPEDVDVLAEPLLAEADGQEVPVVCFAGEVTSRKHIGTTTGAFHSGVREAERLIAAFVPRQTAAQS